MMIHEEKLRRDENGNVNEMQKHEQDLSTEMIIPEDTDEELSLIHI